MSRSKVLVGGALVVEFVPVIDDAVSEIVALDEPVKLRKGVKQFAAADRDARRSRARSHGRTVRG